MPSSWTIVVWIAGLRIVVTVVPGTPMVIVWSVDFAITVEIGRTFISFFARAMIHIILIRTIISTDYNIPTSPGIRILIFSGIS